MTLLITVFAAVAVTVIWYTKKNDGISLAPLMFMFWGASLMWLVDAIFEYRELGDEFFTPAPADMLNDAFLGFSVIALALVIWVAILLVKDPKGVVKKALSKKALKKQS